MKKNIFWYINILSLEVIVFVVGNYYFICYYLFVRCNMNLLNEFDNNKNAVINPCDFIKKINNMPEVAIACFSSVLFEKIINGSKCIEIGKLHNTNGYKSIYEIEYKGKRLAIFMMAVGAPAAVADIEDIHEMGSKKIIVFGNQVSSIFLKEKITVSQWRKKKTKIKIKKNEYDVYPVYYPVGNGMRNIDLVIEDLKYIIGE